jgi:hypothetical protein
MNTIKTIAFYGLLLMINCMVFGQNPRLLITTDIGGDPDDQQSLVRLMLYANEFDIEGIITSASGTPGELKEAVVRPDLVEEIIHGYQAVYSSLLKHDGKFPAPEYLLSLVKRGNPQRGLENTGEGHDTEGSDWIISRVDQKDNRLLNICIFGGQTDLAQALWKVKNSRSEREYQKFVAKIRTFDIADQDHIYNEIAGEHPSLFYVLSKAPEGADKREGAFRGMYLGGDESLTSLEWLKEHVIEDHGPLGKLYPTKTWTAPNPYGAMKEGDTPSWFFFLQNGLNDPAHPNYGGWGGRYTQTENGFYRDAQDFVNEEKNARATVYRWRDDFQRTFAARMDWCLNDYGEANHPPIVSVNGFSKKEALRIKSKSGNTIELNASESTDPDGNSLSFEWNVYPEAGNLTQPVQIKTDSANASLVTPKLNPGSSLHIILKVSDDGLPRLTSYKRIIIQNR